MWDGASLGTEIETKLKLKTKILTPMNEPREKKMVDAKNVSYFRNWQIPFDGNAGFIVEWKIPRKIEIVKKN